jgi:hypothetical protein
MALIAVNFNIERSSTPRSTKGLENYPTIWEFRCWLWDQDTHD